MEQINVKAIHKLGRLPPVNTLFLLTFLVGIIVLQQVVSVQQSSLMGRALLNSAHTPWFFAISIGLWLLVDKKLKASPRHKVIIFLVTLTALAFALEAVQLLNHRQASFGDVLRNLVGAGSATLCLFALTLYRQSHRSFAAGLWALAFLIFLTGFKGVGELLWLRYQLIAQAPVIMEFSQTDSVTLRILRGSWEKVPGIPEWPQYQDTSIVRVDLSEQTRWPGLILREPLRDWRPYSWLVMDAFSPLDAPLDLDLRLQTFTDRGSNSIYTLQLLPGANRLRIPIAELTNDKLSPDSVRNLLIYTEFDGSRENYFYLGQLRLE